MTHANSLQPQKNGSKLVLGVSWSCSPQGVGNTCIYWPHCIPNMLLLLPCPKHQVPLSSASQQQGWRWTVFSVQILLRTWCFMNVRLTYGEPSAYLWASGFVWAYIKYPCLSTSSVLCSCVTTAIGISDGNLVTQLVCAYGTKGWSHHTELPRDVGTSWELMLLYWMSVAYNVFPCSVKTLQGQPTKCPLKMSGKSKQRMCHNCHLIFFVAF